MSDQVIQAKHGLNFISNHYKSSAVQDNDYRRRCSSPPPAKHARIQGCVTSSSNHSKRADNAGIHGCCELISCRKDDAIDLKLETSEDLGNGPGQEELTFCQKDILSVSNSSVTSTNSCLPQSNNVGSTNSPLALMSPSSVYGETNPPSFKSEHSSTCTVEECAQDQPDSSSISFYRSKRENDQPGSQYNLVAGEVQTSSGLSAMTSVSKNETTMCQVCQDVAAGFYCGAYICEACKKFFIRASKLDQPRYVCLRSKNCLIKRESRVHCQYCRYQRCLQLNMYYPKDGQKHSSKMGVQEIPCRVCSAPSSGFHFGALTCEGCKGFFRRMVKERDSYSYKCSRDGNCEVNALTRNMCKACRYNKCLHIGMSVEGSRIGRQPNAVKHAISLEVRKQTALKIEPGSDMRSRDSSPSHLSFDSVALDLCLPGELDDGLQSVSSSADARRTESREMDVMKPGLLLSPQENHILTRAEHHDLLEAPMSHSDIIRHHMPNPEYDKHIQNICSSSSSLPSLSINIPSDIKPRMFESPQKETFNLLSVDQAENLSVGLSVIQTSNTSTGHMCSPSTVPTSNIVHLSSSVHPASTPPPYSISLPSPSAHHPASPHYYPIDYTCRNQLIPTYPHFINNLVDQNQNCRLGYQHSEKYENNTSVCNVDSQNAFNSNDQELHISQQEQFISRLYTQNAQFQILGNNFSSPFHQGVISKEIQMPQSHLLGSQPLHQPQSLLSRHTTRDIHTAEYQTFASQKGKCDTKRNRQNVISFSDRPCSSLPLHQLNLSQQMSHCQPNKFPPSYAAPHFLPQYSVLPVTPYPCDVPRHLSASPQSNNIPDPLRTTAVEVTTTTRNQYDKTMPTEELHAILLNAARNLAHFCAVNRAKSDVYDPDRFKDVDSTWEKMMEHFNFHAKCIVRFAKRVPGFRSLKIDDQVLLLRMATYSLVILNHSRAYEPDTGFYNYFNFTQRETQMIRDLFPEFNVIHTHYKHMGSMAQRQGFTEVEYAYMSCMLLLNNEYPGLENTEMTKELKERYMAAFLDYEIEHFPKGRLRFAEMLLYLSEFSQLSMQHNIAVGLVITKNPQLHIPELYAEMYTNNGSAIDSGDSTNEDDASDVCELHEPPVVGIVK
ncbi:hypothetical protein BsWGS_14910 [Bradybaena similaris]